MDQTVFNANNEFDVAIVNLQVLSASRLLERSGPPAPCVNLENVTSRYRYLGKHC